MRNHRVRLRLSLRLFLPSAWTEMMMRRALLAALVGSTISVAPAFAQGQPQVTPNVVPQGQAQGKAAVAECQQLISLLQSAPRAAGVTEEQARRWLAAGDAQSCTDARQRVQAQISPNPTASPPGPSTVNGHRSLLDCGLPKFPSWRGWQDAVINRCCDRLSPFLVGGRAAWGRAEVR